ncbi:class I SAM-dependent methyltransferase [Nocardioides yefusunii]|uniref:Class I SAM-dependent methyltransferase n=1 Tax=Nocardioides yefusunii TaxID=2500546 RepID=A0ABW1R2V5_9ACTN|nr:class I SAM-dependent methyltransferase [Nocardioides yefusunii]
MSEREQGYLHGHHPTVLASHGARTAANSAAYLLPHLTPGTTLLDVGFGPGTITADLAELVAPGRVAGVEQAQGALDAAQAVLDERGITTVELRVGDAYALPFADGEFDVVHCHQVLQHVGDPVAVLAEMNRVAKKVVAAREADYAAMHWYPENPGMTAWLKVYQETARALGGEPDAGRHLRAWARAARLHRAGRLEVTTSTWTYADDDATSWWGNSQADRVTYSEWHDRILATGRSEVQVEAIAEGWRSWGAHPDAYFTMVHGELMLIKD